MSIDSRQDLGGNQSDRLQEFERYRSVSLSTIIPRQIKDSRRSVRDLSIYDERVPISEFDEVYDIGDIEATLYRETCFDVNGKETGLIYTVWTGYTIFQVKLSNDHKDITTCKELEETLIEQKEHTKQR